MGAFDCINEMPLIICGHPKSGTTLMASLLDNHSQLLVFPEEFKFFQKVYQPKITSSLSSIADIILTQTGFNALRYDYVEFPSGPRDYSEINFDKIENEIRELCKRSNTYYEILIGCMRIWSNAQDYNETKSNKKYWVEKTPGNERYIYI